jgi:hypothetical protein
VSWPKEAMFEKLEELSQHMKPLYIRGHINRRRCCQLNAVLRLQEAWTE